MHSRLSSRVLSLLILLQFAVGSVAWLESRSLQGLDSRLLDQHAALIHYHERQQVLADELSAIGGRSEPGASTDSAQRVRAERLSETLKRLAQDNPAVPREQLASARALSDSFARIASGAADAPSFERTLHETSERLEQWRAAANPVDAAYHQWMAASRRAYEWLEADLAATPLFLLGAVLCVNILKRDARRQTLRREAMEAELRRERALLETHIEARTAELQAEVAVRMRFEQLHRGRNRMLEMLAREEPAKNIFDALVDVVAKDRTRWCCALHLVEAGDLRLEASCGLPVSLLRNLQQLATDMADAPEAMALRERTTQALEDLAQERRPWPHLLHASGIQSLWTTPIFAPDGTPLGTLTVYSLLRCRPTEADLDLLESHAQMASMVLERYRLQQELRRHAYHDSLTGLPNRLLGEEQLSGAILRGRRTHQPVAILWIDLDKFKQTNDVHGHLAGDAVLREVAARLAKRFRESDCIARMGGDEFMAVLEGIKDRSDVERIAEQLTRDLALPIPFQGLNLHTGASIGISLFPEDGESAYLLQRNADLAMYEAKFGQHGVRTFSPALDSVLSARRELETAMLEALEGGGFCLFYQPQYERYGRLAGFEALLRLPHPRLGMVPPARLIPIAEESQMIVALGGWVLREACRQSRRWRDAGYTEVPVAVNISAMQFARRDFAEQVDQALRDSGLAPELLELELTESLMVQDFEESTRQLERLKRLGVSIALDDFGTGYSSLNQLHRLPIDRIKIDRSFTQALHDPLGTLPIVESIIVMAHRMQMNVVAEGVETTEQMRLLRLNGCDVLQGFLFSPPVDAHGAEKLLAAGKSSLLALDGGQVRRGRDADVDLDPLAKSLA